MKKGLRIACKILSVFLSVLLVVQIAPMEIMANAYNEATVNENTENALDVPSDDIDGTESEAEIIAEEASKREENVKHFRMSDGSYRAAQYDVPVHFMQNGEWTDYDNTLTEVDADDEENDNKLVKNKDLKNTLSDYTVRLSKKTNGKKFVRIEKDGYKLSWYYTNAKKSTAQITEVATDDDDTTLEKLSSRVTYEDVYKNTDFEYIVGSNGLKENIILKKSNVKTTFEAEYKANGLTPVQVDSHTINLVAEDDTVVFTLSAPYMMDVNGESSTNVAITLSNVNNNSFTITTTLDETWLADENRAYPVTVDPVIKTKQDYKEMDSTFVGAKYPNRCYHTYSTDDSGSLYVGNISGYGQTESYLKLNTLPTLSVADKVVGAQLSIVLWDCDNGLQLDIKRLTQSWAMNQVTWNTKPTADSTIVDYAILTHGEEAKWLDFDVTDLVRGWYSGDYPNYGISFSTTKTTSAKAWLFSSDFSEGATTEYRPIFQISYINMAGFEDYWSYTQQNLGSGVGYVNNATGSLVVNIPICDTGSTSLPASISYYYNGYQAGKHFYVTQGGNNILSKSICGAGWKLNVDEQLAYLTPGLDNNDDLHEQGIKYTYTDADGTVLYMKQTEDDHNVFEDELGKGYTLTVMDNGTWELTDKQNNKKTFTSGGRLLYVQSNQSNDKITYAYDGNSFLKTITDGSGHTINITRNVNNAITAITSSLGTTNFYYSGSKLVQIQYPDGKSIYFTYDSDYRLTSVTSRDGSKVTYTYPTSGLDAHKNRVTKVCEYSSSGVIGNYVNLEYTPGNFTKVTDNKNRSVVYNFDNCGRTTSVVDDFGASSTNYTTNVAADSSSTGQYTEQNNKITGVSSTILPVDNLLKNHSFENGKTSWGSGNGDAQYCSTSDSTNAFIGGKSIKFTSDITTHNAIMYQYYTPAKTGDYTFSFYYKTDGLTGSGGVRAMLELQKTDGTSTFISCPYNRDNTNGEWLRVSVTANIGSDIQRIVGIIGFQYTIGTAYVDCAQLEYGSSANRYNLVENGSFTQGSYGWTHNMASGDSFNTTQGSIYDSAANGTECPEFITHGAFMKGVANTNKYVRQDIKINMPANKIALQFSGFACGESVPKKSGRLFCLDLKFGFTDGTSQFVVVDFNYDSTTWQYVSQLVLPSQSNMNKTVDHVSVYFLYYQNQNWACFTGMNLNIDKSGVVYSYDEKGNVVSAKDMAERNTVSTIDNVNRMTGYKDEENVNYTYTYNEDNATLGTTKYQLKTLVHNNYAQRYEYEYDKHGNVIKTVKRHNVTDTSSVYPMRSDSSYSENGDRLLSTTDTLRNTTTYGYNSSNSNDLRLYSVTQNGKTVNYQYVQNTSLVSRVWSQFNNINGTTQTAENTYTYTNDRLSSITHNGFSYNFTYDSFGNRLSTSVGSRVLMTNEYEPNNGRLKKSTYGNGAYVENEYDALDRVTGVKYNGTKLFGYVYNAEGLVSRHIDNVNQKTYNYIYDMIGRVQRTEISDGNSISYQYNNLNQTTGTSYKFNGVTKNSSYDYFKSGIPCNVTYPNGATKTRSLNGQAQVRPITLTTATGNQWSNTITYYTPTTNDGVLYTTNLVGSYTFNNFGRTIQYTYDGSGNIATRTDTANGVSTTTEYFYDELNQLIRENDPVANKTTTYVYDNGGNILQKKEYAYTTGVLGTVKRTINYTYDSEWKDLLIKYGNLSVTYDEIGNPITFDGATLTWEQGRKLSSITMANGATVSYKYDANGIRTQKTVAGVTTDYFLQGSTIVAQKTGDNVIWYYFDGDGTRDAIEYNGTVYYYMYNPQGDVIGLFDDNLNVVVEYKYDSWGNILSITGSLASTLGQDNPFRYRGYYYDNESGLYYLNSRYYHPEIGRFINADGYVQTGQGLLDKNMFAYCGNNPVNRVDPTGQSWADVKNWVAEKWNSVKKTIENTWNKLKTNITNAFKELPYETADDAALASGINLNNLTQQNNHEYGQGIVYNRITKTYGLTDIVQGKHSSVNFSSTINNNKNLVAVVHSHPCCNGHIGNEFSNAISDDNGNVYGDWVVASSNSINVYLAAPNGNLYVMYWDVGEYNQNFVCDGLPIDNSQINCG